MNDNLGDTLLSLFLGAVSALLAGMLAHGCAVSRWQTECVSRGAAEWLVDDSGTTEFHWLLEPKEKP